MRVSVKFGQYNDRRYGKPWIAKVVSWSIGNQPELEWGGFIGDYSGGEGEIEAEPGDIIRYGQKDHRSNKTENNWGVVNSKGIISGITPVEARKLWSKKVLDSGMNAV